MGYLPTNDRLNSFNFSKPYTPNFAVTLQYPIGEIEGDPLDVTGKKIGKDPC